MAYTTIDDPTKYFVTVLYTGNDTARTITTGLETTDFIWNKRRDSAGSHLLYDKVRGINKDLNSESTEAEETQVGTVTAFGTDNFSLGTHGGTNANGETKVNWCWSAGGTTGSSNTDGSITSTVSANTTSGFSIVSYTGNGTDGATVGHGLGVNPSAILFKRRDSTSNWSLMGQNIGTAFSNYLKLETTDAFNTNAGMLQNSNSSTFTIGTNSRVNTSSASMIAYCFAEKKGYSKFGSYTGNGSNDGTFVYTGFKPAFCIVKRTDGSADWNMYDNKRIGYNPLNYFVYPNLSNAEDTSNPQWFDLLSNGFQLRNTSTMANTSGGSYIYMAFAENPFVTSTGIPTTAR